MKSSPWIHVQNPQPTPRLRLFCFPYAGGSASAFRDWSKQLPAPIEVCAFQLPGRMDRYREPPLDTLAPILGGIIDALTPCLGEAPFAFFGHSMGALLAFEVTRLLERRSAPLPVHLMVSAALPPRAAGRSRGLSKLPEAALIRELHRMGGLAKAIMQERELMALLIPAVRADLRAFESWIPPSDAPVTVPLTAFGGQGDAHPTPPRIQEWQPETTGAFQSRIFPGGHFYLHESTRELLAVVAECLSPHLELPGRLSA